MSLTLRQVEGYLYAPDQRIRKLAETAQKALEERDELRRVVREMQEQQAVDGLAASPILILADHKGCIEVKAEQFFPVKIVPIHESDDRNPDNEDDDARNRTPLKYQHLWECRSIATGHVGLDRYRRSWGEAVLLMRDAMKGMEP